MKLRVDYVLEQSPATRKGRVNTKRERGAGKLLRSFHSLTRVSYRSDSISLSLSLSLSLSPSLSLLPLTLLAASVGMSNDHDPEHSRIPVLIRYEVSNFRGYSKVTESRWRMRTERDRSVPGVRNELKLMSEGRGGDEAPQGPHGKLGCWRWRTLANEESEEDESGIYGTMEPATSP